MELLALGASVARDAGALLRDRFRRPRSDVDTKTSATDMVTDADRASERLIVQRIAAARPGDAILAEETGESGGTTGVRWIVDPLDGTTNFLYGIPQFCVSIACEDEHGPLAGVVYDVARDECFAAARGRGATLDGAPIHPADAADLARALLATGFSYRPEERAVQAAMMRHILPRVRDVRRAGSAALDLAWTACGRVDCFFEAWLAPWDRAAGMLLVAEAGGSVALVDVFDHGPGVLAAGPGLFEPLRALVGDALRDARPGR